MVEYMYELGQVLYAVAENGFYRSANRGDTWTRVKAPLEPKPFSMAEVKGTLYYSCITLNQDSALFRSDDNGLTWRVSPPPSEVRTWVDRVESLGGYLFLTSSGAVYRSRPDSAGWTRIGNPGTPAIWHWQSEGDTLWAFGRNGAFHTIDTGMIWIRDTPTDEIPEITIRWWKGARMLGSIYPTNDLIESKDFGATWTKLDQPFDILPRVALHSSGPNLLAHSRDETVFITSDFGVSWSRPSGDLRAMTDVDGVVFALAGYGELRQSNTHGATWSLAPLAIRLPLFTGPLAGGAGWLYAATSDSIFRRPAALDTRPWQYCPARTDPPRKNGVAYFAKLLAMGPQVYASTWDGRWQYSLDTAKTWNPVPASLQAAGPRDFAGQGVVLSGTDGGLYRSADSGKTWDPMTAPGQPALGDTVFSVLRSGNAFFAGGRGRIFYSLDEGLTWGSMGPAGFEGNVDEMEVQGGRLAFIAPGAGIWSGPLPAGYSAPVAITDPSRRHGGEPGLAQAGFRLKPGILRPGDRVEFRLPVSGPVRLSLYSVAGKRLADLYAGRLAAGSHSLALDPASREGMRAGYHLLRLKAGTRSWTMGAVLQP